MIPTSHHGTWSGPNQLWLGEPEPERSDAFIQASEARLSYAWSFRGTKHRGELDLQGPPAACGCSWQDSWHAEHGMVLHGHAEGGLITLYGTYGVEEVVWGWRIEIDAREPERLELRMFNVEPGGAVAPAVHLRGSR